MASISKDLKQLSSVYGSFYAKTKQVLAEQSPVDLGGGVTIGGAQSAATKSAATASPGAPVTSAGVPGAASDATPGDLVKQDFDKATTAYLRSLNVSDADIKKFIDSTHTMLQGFSNKSAAPNIGGASSSTPPAAPAATPPASTAQYMPALGGRGLTGQAGGRPAYASR